MRLKAETKNGVTVFTDEDSGGEVFYEMPTSGNFPASMEGIATEHELAGIVMHAPVANGSGWNSPMVERLERRRNDLRVELMSLYAKELENGTDN